MKYVLILLLMCMHTVDANTFTVVLDPAGSAQHAGRIIDDSFEHGIALMCIDAIKKHLENTQKNIRFVSVPTTHHQADFFQKTSIINRLNIDLYIVLHCYQNMRQESAVYIYHCLYHPTTDFWRNTKDPLSFTPLHQAHCLVSLTSKWYGLKAYDILQTYAQQFSTHGVFGLPCAPLIGLLAPALMLELNLTTKSHWQLYVQPLANVIAQCAQLSAGAL